MTTAEVRLWGTKIGAVTKDNDSPYAFFRYDPDFIRSGIAVSPLMMPLSDTTYRFPSLPYGSFHGLPGLLADSLPDKFGNAVIDAWLTAQGRSIESFDSVERLCYIGTRGMGALEFFPNKSKDYPKTEEIKIDQLVELCNDILAKRTSLSARGEHSMQQLINVGISAGGARAKAIVAYNENTKEFRSGQVEVGDGFSYWIVKFDGISKNQDRDEDKVTAFTRIEYAYYLMATSAGITMSESRLYSEGGRHHFMTKRFDRIEAEDGRFRKLHMQTLAALTHFDYNIAGLMSYEAATQTMSRLGLSQKDIEQFFRRMVFNVMARNQDDHIKNISFLMDRRGVWSLSPAYDVTYAYNPEGDWTRSHQMPINGKISDITMDDLKISAVAMNIKERDSEKIIQEITQALEQWNEFAKQAHLDAKTANLIKSNFLFFSSKP